MIDFSIVIQVLNRKDFIKRSIESILIQDFKSYEILVVDNGSTDGTLNVLKQYEKSGKIKLYLCLNKGVSYARNMGITKARGQFIHILDSDNYFTNQYSLHNLRKIIEGLSNNWEVILTSNINTNGNSISNSPCYNVFMTHNDYLKTSGEFSITAKTSWYLNNLHPEIENVTHEIIFPAFLISAKRKNLYLSDHNVQTYSVEAPNRLSSADLTQQQIINYVYYYKYSIEAIFSLLTFKHKLIYINKFFIYNRLYGGGLSLKVNFFYNLFSVFYTLIPRSIVLNFVKRMRK